MNDKINNEKNDKMKTNLESNKPSDLTPKTDHNSRLDSNSPNSILKIGSTELEKIQFNQMEYQDRIIVL